MHSQTPGDFPIRLKTGPFEIVRKGLEAWERDILMAERESDTPQQPTPPEPVPEGPSAPADAPLEIRHIEKTHDSPPVPDDVKPPRSNDRD